MKKVLKNIFSGIGVGMANVIPGLSGGTLLVLTGTFEPLTEAIAMGLKPHNPKRKSHWLLILEIFIGLILGIAAFSYIIPILSKHIYAQLVIFFLGLVLASSWIYFKNEIQSVKNVNWISLSIGFLICLAMVLFIHSNESIEPVFDTHLNGGLLFTLLGLGILAGAAMIFPGISGSLLLFMFGMYYKVWGYVKETLSQLIHLQWNWYMIIPCIFIGVGILVGIFGSSMVSKIVLKKYRKGTLSLILGLIIGGCVALIPMPGNIPNGISIHWNVLTIMTVIVAFVLGMTLILLIQWLMKSKANKQQKNKI